MTHQLEDFAQKDGQGSERPKPGLRHPLTLDVRDGVEPPRGWLALALLCAAQFMVVLDFSIVNVALPSMQKSLGFSPPIAAWLGRSPATSAWRADRKSTRLNSSHTVISYPVFCLKKKGVQPVDTLAAVLPYHAGPVGGSSALAAAVAMNPACRPAGCVTERGPALALFASVDTSS